MPKPRALRRRIRSVENTRKITRTMEMVATSKLKRAQDRVVAARPYAEALAAVLADLLTPELAERFPLLREAVPLAKGGPNRAALLLITSNRGLAGAFNANLIKLAGERVRALEAADYRVDLLAVGRKGINYFRFVRRALALARADIGDRPTAAHAEELVRPLVADYQAGRLASLDLVYARFKSALATRPTLTRVLPVEAVGRSGGRTANFIIKPGVDALLGALLPLYVKNAVYRALVETAASEQGARRTAMKNATDNAGEMLEILRRSYNRARQAQITQEIAEIVGGAEVLKG